ncbi:hypothetical protein [Streptomyces sp. NPDC002067]
MDNGTKVSLTAAMAAGYLLGRTRKGKLAIGLASLVAGRHIPLSPREAVGLGVRKLAQNPQFAPLIEQARGEVLDAGRTALSATANRSLESLAGALEQRTNALREPVEDDGAEEEDAAAEVTAEEGEEEAGEKAGEKEKKAEGAQGGRSEKRRAESHEAGKTAAKKGAAEKSTDRKPAAKKAEAKKAPARHSRRR